MREWTELSPNEIWRAPKDIETQRKHASQDHSLSQVSHSFNYDNYDKCDLEHSSFIAECVSVRHRKYLCLSLTDYKCGQVSGIMWSGANVFAIEGQHQETSQ